LFDHVALDVRLKWLSRYAHMGSAVWVLIPPAALAPGPGCE
jgi:hypothetical protein